MTEYSGFRAKEIHAFFMIDGDDEEGIPAFSGGGGMMMPLIATDRVAVDHMTTKIATAMAQARGQRVEHVVFTSRQHVEWINDEPSTD